jgi:hypothetical protein
MVVEVIYARKLGSVGRQFGGRGGDNSCFLCGKKLKAPFWLLKVRKGSNGAKSIRCCLKHHSDGVK